jgi:hypothetical protein
MADLVGMEPEEVLALGKHPQTGAGHGDVVSW